MFQVDDRSHGSGAFIVFDPSEADIHRNGSPVWASPYVKLAIAASMFVSAQTPVQRFLQADILHHQSTSLLSCELFEAFSILQLCHKGLVQVGLFLSPFFCCRLVGLTHFAFRLILIKNPLDVKSAR